MKLFQKKLNILFSPEITKKREYDGSSVDIWNIGIIYIINYLVVFLLKMMSNSLKRLIKVIYYAPITYLKLYEKI